MTNTAAYTTQTEAVGLFHSASELQDAVDELLSHGFDRMDLSVLASEKTIEEKLGHKVRSVRELEDAPEVPATAFISNEAVGDAEGALAGTFIYIPAVAATGAVVASGGTLAAAVAACAIAGGIGATLGGILGFLIGRQFADQIEEHLKRGGLLLWVRTRDEAHEKRAGDVLKASGAEDVHLHKLPSLSAG